MTWRTDVNQLLAGRWVTSRYNGHGVLGAVVLALADGPNGPPFGRGDLESPADDAAEVRWEIRRYPQAGTFTVRENSEFTFVCTTPGRYFFDVEGFRNSRSQGMKRVFLLVGPQPTLIEQLQVELTPLVAGKAWYGMNTSAAKVEERYPFIVMQIVASPPNVTLKGPSDLQNTRVQIDIHARTIAEAREIEATVQQRMSEWTLQNVPLSRLDLPDEATRIHRVVLDYSIWSYG